MCENHMSYYKTARKYWDTDSHYGESKLMSTIHRWKCIYLAEGVEGLMKERRSRRRKG